MRWIPSLISSLSLLSLGVLSLTQAMESRRDMEPQETRASPEDMSRDNAIIEKLEVYVAAQKPCLNPDLTLSRLSRRLVIPAMLDSGFNTKSNFNREFLRIKGKPPSSWLLYAHIFSCGLEFVVIPLL